MAGDAGGHQRAVNRIGAIVDQRLPRQSRYGATGFVHQKVGRRKVPVMAVGRGKAAVQRAAGDAGNTQRKRRHPWRDLDAGLDRGQHVEAALGCGKFAHRRVDRPRLAWIGNPIEGGTAARDRQEQLVVPGA